MINSGHILQEAARISDRASEQRHIHHEFGRKVLATFTGRGFEEWTFRSDFNGLLDIADFELKIEVEALRDANFDVGTVQFFKTGLFDGDHINVGF